MRLTVAHPPYMDTGQVKSLHTTSCSLKVKWHSRGLNDNYGSRSRQVVNVHEAEIPLNQVCSGKVKHFALYSHLTKLFLFYYPDKQSALTWSCSRNRSAPKYMVRAKKKITKSVRSKKFTKSVKVHYLALILVKQR